MFNEGGKHGPGLLCQWCPVPPSGEVTGLEEEMKKGKSN